MKSRKYFILPILFSFLIIGISLLPLPKLPEVKFVALDKIGHSLAFFLLTLTYLWAFKKVDWPDKPINGTLYSFLIGVFIGGGIELLQHYLPVNRFGDFFDFYFDIVGVVIALILFKIMQKSKLLLSLFLSVFMSLGIAQEQSSKEFQEQINAEYLNPEDSPLDSIDLIHFEGLEFFPIDEEFIVEAKLVRQNSPTFFGMKTTTDRRPEYRIWAYAFFTIDAKEYKLTIYQNKKLMNTLEYGDYLFLPFTDESNGKDSYYGGRYVDLRIPKGDSVIIDFNKAYNPYCAYSKRYSCPIVPEENKLDVAIEAGVKKFH